MNFHTNIEKYLIAIEHLDTSIELYLRGDTYYSALHLAGAAEEIFAVYVREINKSPAFDEFQNIVLAFSSPTTPKEVEETKDWIYKRMTYAKNSVKHKRGKKDSIVRFDPKEEAHDLIDRAITTYIQLISHYNMPFISRIRDFDAANMR